MDSAETTTSVCHRNLTVRRVPNPWSRFMAVAFFTLLLLSGPLVFAQSRGTLEPDSTRADWTGRPTQGVQANPVSPQQATTTLGEREEQSRAETNAVLIPESGRFPRTPINRQASVPAEAADTGDSARNPIWTTLGILCLLLAGVYGVLRLLRRYGGQRFSTPGTPLIHLLDQQKLDPQTTVYLLRVGRRIVVTGSSPAGLSQLAEITDPEEVAELCSLHPPDEGTHSSLTSLFSGVRPIRREMSPPAANVVEANSVEPQTASLPKSGSNREAWHA